MYMDRFDMRAQKCMKFVPFGEDVPCSYSILSLRAKVSTSYKGFLGMQWLENFRRVIEFEHRV